jgi:hypothetical protein
MLPERATRSFRRTMSETQSVSAGFPIASILTIIFVIAKLFGKITWPWVWVFAPLWISAVFGFTLVGIVLLIAVIAARVG